MGKIVFDLPDERIAELDALMVSADIRSRKELFNNALTLMEWAEYGYAWGVKTPEPGDIQILMGGIWSPAHVNSAGMLFHHGSEVTACSGLRWK